MQARNLEDGNINSLFCDESYGLLFRDDFIETLV